MGGEIEKLSEAAFQRNLARGPASSPGLQAGAGATMIAGGVGLIVFGSAMLPTMALLPFYFVTGVGVLFVGMAARSWRQRRRRAIEDPPVPPARLLP